MSTGIHTSVVILLALVVLSGGIRLRYYKDKGKSLSEDDQIEDEEDYFDNVDEDDDDDDDYVIDFSKLGDNASPPPSSSSSSSRTSGHRGVDKWMVTMNISRLSPPPSDEKRLTKYLLQNYKKVGPGGRPVVNSSLPLQVQFGLAMIQMDLDERDNTLTISVWCRYRWNDEYLTWDPADFGGVRSVRLSSRQVWIPDIMLYNTADTHKLEREVLVVISYNGSILWIPHRIYRSSCSVDVTDFPFDRQTCHLTFGSWAYHGNEIDLRFFENLDRMDISDLEKENTEWDITEKMEKRKIQYYDCCTEPYVTLVFTLMLRRKLVFSSFILTLPCIFLAFMTLVVFWLPPERPDRTSLAMNLFASFLLLLLILVEAAPPTASSVPKLGIYYCFNMILIMVSIFMSSVIINISRRGESLNRVPSWLRTISRGCLAKAFCTDLSPNSRQIQNRHAENTTRDDPNRHHGVLLTSADGLDPPRSELTNGVPNPEAYGASSLRHSLGGSTDTFFVKMLHSHFMMLESQLRCVENSLREIARSLKDKDITKEMREIRLEWQVVALTLDRILFCVFVIAIVLSLILLFPRPY